MKRKMKKILVSMLAVCLCLGSLFGQGMSVNAADTTEPEFKVTGASVRFVNNHKEVDGFRYAVAIRKDIYNKLTTEEKENYRLLIMPKVLIDGELEVDESYSYTVNGVSYTTHPLDLPIWWNIVEQQGDYMVTHVYINGIDKSCYNMDLVGRMYYENEDGDEPEYSNECGRSYIYVAEQALTDESVTYTAEEESALLKVLYQIQENVSGAAILSRAENGVTMTLDTENVDTGTKTFAEAYAKDVRNKLPNTENFTLEVDMSKVYPTGGSDTQQGVRVGGVFITMNSRRLVVNHDAKTNLLFEATANDTGPISALANPIPSELTSNPFTWIIKVSRANGPLQLTVSVKVNETTTVLLENMDINALRSKDIEFFSLRQLTYDPITTTFSNLKVTDDTKYVIEKNTGTASVTWTNNSLTLNHEHVVREDSTTSELMVKDLHRTLPNMENFMVQVDMSAAAGNVWTGSAGLKVGGTHITINKNRLQYYNENTGAWCVYNDGATEGYVLQNSIPDAVESQPFTLIVMVSNSSGSTTLTMSVKIGTETTVLVKDADVKILNTEMRYYMCTSTDLTNATTTFSNVTITDTTRLESGIPWDDNWSGALDSLLGQN